jgi:hypothetical protein
MGHCDDSKLIERDHEEAALIFFFSHRDQIQGTQTIWLFLLNHHSTSHVLRNAIIESTTVWTPPPLSVAANFKFMIFRVFRVQKYESTTSLLLVTFACDLCCNISSFKISLHLQSELIRCFITNPLIALEQCVVPSRLMICCIYPICMCTSAGNSWAVANWPSLISPSAYWYSAKI